MNPFNLSGPEFLVLYVVVTLGIFCLAWLKRLSMSVADDPGASPPRDLTPEEIAFLVGGETMVINAAVAKLVHAGIIAQNPETKVLESRQSLPASPSDIDRVIYNAVQEGSATFTLIAKEGANLYDSIRDRLWSYGLLVTLSQNARLQNVSFLIAMAAPAFGFVKILMGMSRGRPVGILMVLCVVTAVIAWCLFQRPVFRTRQGDDTLNLLRNEHAALETQGTQMLTGLSAGDLMLAVALFGLPLLAGSQLGSFLLAFQPTPQSGAGGFSWFPYQFGSSSCNTGGSSCSSGSSGGSDNRTPRNNTRRC